MTQGILDLLRTLFGGAVRERAESRKEERLNFQAVNRGWSVYAATMDKRAKHLENELARVQKRLDDTITMERECQTLLGSAGRSIGEAHGKIAALTSRIAELERRR